MLVKDKDVADRDDGSEVGLDGRLEVGEKKPVFQDVQVQ